MKNSGWTWGNLLAGVRRRFRREKKSSQRKFQRRPVLESLECRKLLSVTANIRPLSLDPGQVGYLTVALSQPLATPATVNYTVTNGSAVLGTDYYLPPKGTISFVPGQTVAESIPVHANADPGSLADRSFTISLSDPTGGLTLGTSQAEGTIIEPQQQLSQLTGRQGVSLDSQTAPAVNVSITGPGQVTGGNDADFPVTLSRACDSTVTVSYYVGSGTAPTSAYSAGWGYVDIAAESTTGTIVLPTYADGNEANGTYFCTELESASDSTGDSFTFTANAEATATLQEPGVSATVNISGPGTIDEGTTAAFELSLNGTCQSNVTVSYTTSDGSADAGTNYVAESGTAIIPAGQTSAWIGVSTINQGGNLPYDAYFSLVLEGATDGNSNDSISASGSATATLQSTAISATVGIGDAGTVSGGNTASFPVTISPPCSYPMTLSYYVGGGDAPSQDYAGGWGSTTISAGSTTGTIDVQTYPDSKRQRQLLQRPIGRRQRLQQRQPHRTRLGRRHAAAAVERRRQHQRCGHGGGRQHGSLPSEPHAVLQLQRNAHLLRRLGQRSLLGLSGGWGSTTISMGSTTATIDIQTNSDASAGNGSYFYVSPQNASDSGGDSFYMQGSGAATLQQPVNVSVSDAGTVSGGKRPVPRNALPGMQLPRYGSYYVGGGNAPSQDYDGGWDSTTISAGSTTGTIDVQTYTDSYSAGNGTSFDVSLQMPVTTAATTSPRKVPAPPGSSSSWMSASA